MILPLLLAVQAGANSAEPLVYHGRRGETQVAIPRIDAAVEVDGVLGEEAWRLAARLTDFSQYAPVDGRPAENATDVLVWYSSTHVHFGVRASAAPGSVRATLANRDRLDADDSVQFLLSTFNNGRQAWLFAVNPLGVQADGALVEGVRRQGDLFAGLDADREAPDLSPDFVFESRGRLTPEGYEVEPVQEPALSGRRAPGLGPARHPQGPEQRPRGELGARAPRGRVLPVPGWHADGAERSARRAGAGPDADRHRPRGRLA